jgi:hypothetical protein
MSWENTIKAPPPRPSDKDIPKKSRYFGPRWLKTKTESVREAGFHAAIDISPIHSNFDAFIVNVTDFYIFEDLSALNIEDIKRRLEADVGEGKLTIEGDELLTESGYLASEVYEVYDQMLDDIYDDFEVWDAYGGWKMFNKKYHTPHPDSNRNLHKMRPRFGGDLYIIAQEVEDWKQDAQELMNSKYPAMNVRIRTTVTNLLNGLQQLKPKTIQVLNPSNMWYWK